MAKQIIEPRSYVSSTGALNHSVMAARARRWLPPKYVKIYLSWKFLVVAKKKTSALAWGLKKLIFGTSSQRMKPHTLWSYVVSNEKYYTVMQTALQKIGELF